MDKKSRIKELGNHFFSNFLEMLDRAPVSILITDVNGIILDLNHTLRNFLAYKKGELTNFQIKDVIKWNQEGFNSNNPSELFKKLTNTQERVLGFYITKENEELPMECYGIKMGPSRKERYVIFGSEITQKQKLKKELKQCQRELNETLSKHPELQLWRLSQRKEDLDLVDQSISTLKKTQKNYKEIISSISEGYFEISTSGRFTFVNRGLCRILGFSKNELLDLNYEDILADSNEANKIKEVWDDGLKDDTYELTLKKKDGSKITIETSLMSKKEDGEIIKYFGILRDVTSRKKIERLEKQFREELEHKVKVRTQKLKNALDSQKKLMDEILKTSRFKSEFLAHFSHELRTPLNAIMGFTELLLEESYGALKEDQKSFLLDIKDSSKHLLDLIDNLLDLSKIESGKIKIRKEEFDLEPFIGQINATFNSQFQKKDLEFRIVIDKSIQSIKTDPIRLKQILFNLLSNALKFTFNGGVLLKITDSNKNWKFTVKDTGIGIKKENHHLVFKEFKRVESNKTDNIQGSGLGLPLTKRLVNLLGGNIDFESEAGEGSIFSLMLSK